MRLTARAETWPIHGVFRIARGEVREVSCLVVELEDEGLTGRGEASPDPDLGTTAALSLTLVESVRQAIEAGADRRALQILLPPCPARNAIDCALWDLEARRAEKSVADLAGLPPPRIVQTVYTLSLDTPAAMAEAAAGRRHMPVLKIKLGGADDEARVAAIRAAAPDCRLIVDANESWSPGEVEGRLHRMTELGVSMVEQPLPKGGDQALARFLRPLPVCADESCGSRADLPDLIGRYDMINIKLDKTGGLTGALQLVQAAKQHELGIMVGCMLGSSLAMAPAFLLTPWARFVDLDAPLLLAKDREPGMRYEGSLVYPPSRTLWG